MDPKELRTNAPLSISVSDDSSKYVHSSPTLQTNKIKSYHAIGPASMGKVDAAAVRPCAIIGPDRVLPQTAGDVYLKKLPVESWPCIENTYRQPPDYPSRLSDYPPNRNISPRQTFQENMQRIMVPPTYSSIKHSENNSLKNSKLNMPQEAKYCDVPYNMNSNELKSVKNSEIPLSSVNPIFNRGIPQYGWPAGVNVPPRPYPGPDMYQYPDYPSCVGPRPVTITHPHRIHREEAAQVYSERLYQEANIRFKPYPILKEKQQSRYDYTSNFQNTFHPPVTFPPHKYDFQKSIQTHPYPMYPQVPLKYLDRRLHETYVEGYQRPNHQSTFNSQYHNQVLHPPYGTISGNCVQNKSFTDLSGKTISTNKLPYETNNKMFLELDRNKAYPMQDNVYYNDSNHTSHLRGEILLPTQSSLNMHSIPQHQVYRRDNLPMKHFEYNHLYRNVDQSPSLNYTLPRLPYQYSPNTIAISPSDSNTSNDTAQTLGTSQEDCGYVSQSSTNSVRSLDSANMSGANNMFRRHEYNIRAIPRKVNGSDKITKNKNNSTNKKNIDVRQFLQMWNEGEDEGSDSNKEMGPQIYPSNFSVSSKTIDNQEQLYVLDLVNVPNEDLNKYEHIQKISKLPENIKGYNSLELLNQYEELLETSNNNNYKNVSKAYKEHIPKRPNDKENISLPRPLSPLDVEAKISQSVIHKEVGCNFEIKPCSPEMLNAEVATPIQDIIGERIIEKVVNPMSSNSPVLSKSDDNKAHKSDIKRINITSCDIINKQYPVNHYDNLTKSNNYNVQDFESNTGISLASLPRLDNDIELNFPEINQQFIKANKIDIDNHIFQKDSNELNLEPINYDKNNYHHHSSSSPQLGLGSAPEKEFIKLSKYRKNKKCDVMISKDNSLERNVVKAQQRINSVIIKNPDTKLQDENDVSLYINQSSSEDIVQDPEEFLSSLKPTNSEINMSLDKAIDFSLNKTVAIPSYDILNKRIDETQNFTDNGVIENGVILEDEPIELNLPQIKNDETFVESAINSKEQLHHSKMKENEITDFENCNITENTSKKEVSVAVLENLSIITEMDEYENLQEIDEPFDIKNHEEKSLLETPVQKLAEDGKSSNNEVATVINSNDLANLCQENESETLGVKCVMQNDNDLKIDTINQSIDTYDEGTENFKSNSNDESNQILNLCDNVNLSQDNRLETSKVECIEQNGNELKINTIHQSLDIHDGGDKNCKSNNNFESNESIDDSNQILLSTDNHIFSKNSESETHKVECLMQNSIDLKDDENNQSLDTYDDEEENYKSYNNLKLNTSVDELNQILTSSDSVNLAEDNKPKNPQAEYIVQNVNELKIDTFEKNIYHYENAEDIGRSDNNFESNKNDNKSNQTQNSNDNVNITQDNNLVTSQCELQNVNELKVDSIDQSMDSNDNEKESYDININKSNLTQTTKDLFVFNEEVASSKSIENMSVDIPPSNVVDNKMEKFNEECKTDETLDEMNKTTEKHSMEGNVLKSTNDIIELEQIEKNVVAYHYVQSYPDDTTLHNEPIKLNKTSKEDCHLSNIEVPKIIDYSIGSCYQETTNIEAKSSTPLISKNIIDRTDRSVTLKTPTIELSEHYKHFDNNKEILFSENRVFDKVGNHSFSNKEENKNIDISLCKTNTLSKSGKECIKLSKELHSPRFQKLILFREGNCSKDMFEIVKENKKDIPQSNEDTKFSEDVKNMNIFAETNGAKYNLLSSENTTKVESYCDHVKLPNNCAYKEIPSKDLGIFLEAESNDIEKVHTITTDLISFPSRNSLKRSLSESALEDYKDDENTGLLATNKRKKRNNIITHPLISEDLSSIIHTNRRNSISTLCNQDNIFILIDNDLIITEENSNEKVYYTELCHDFENNTTQRNCIVGDTNDIVINEVTVESNLVDDEKAYEESWVDDVACIETVVCDDTTNDIDYEVVSPNQINLIDENTTEQSGIFSDNRHFDKIKNTYCNNMCIDDTQILQTLYMTPQMNVNKTLIDIESRSIKNQEFHKFEDLRCDSKDCLSKLEDKVHTCNNTTAINGKENINTTDTLENKSQEDEVKNDIYVYISGEYNKDKEKSSVNSISCESNEENIYNNMHNSKNSATSYLNSSSPEVSSTTPEDKTSSILLKITNHNGSRISKLNENSTLNRLSYKLTEEKDYQDYNTSIGSSRTLITKAAQKYIPPLKESIRDLKIKLTLPQHRLHKLKQLKKSKVEPKIDNSVIKHKNKNSTLVIPKKPKPKFEDVLKSIDQIQFKKHKDKIKKGNKEIPKVVIKKNENGAHFTSCLTTNDHETYNPDLTGRKWQPWVFLEKNNFIDKMAVKNRVKAVYCHRKNSYVLAEKFRKYKSIYNANFVISQPSANNSTKGTLKYTIKLKHK